MPNISFKAPAFDIQGVLAEEFKIFSEKWRRKKLHIQVYNFFLML